VNDSTSFEIVSNTAFGAENRHFDRIKFIARGVGYVGLNIKEYIGAW